MGIVDSGPAFTKLIAVHGAEYRVCTSFADAAAAFQPGGDLHAGPRGDGTGAHGGACKVDASHKARFPLGNDGLPLLGLPAKVGAVAISDMVGVFQWNATGGGGTASTASEGIDEL